MSKQSAADSVTGSASKAGAPDGDDHQEKADINTPPVQQSTTDAPKNDSTDEVGGQQVSEAGGASLNEETNAGGADAVPDTHG